MWILLSAQSLNQKHIMTQKTSDNIGLGIVIFILVFLTTAIASDISYGNGKQAAFHSVNQSIIEAKGGIKTLYSYGVGDSKYMTRTVMLSCEKHDENGVLVGDCIDFEPGHKDKWDHATDIVNEVEKNGEYRISRWNSQVICEKENL